MGNPLLGEVTVRTPGGASYTLAFGIECLMAIEDSLGFDPEELGALLSGGMKVKLLRQLFHAATRDSHPDLDEAATARVISQVGVLPATAALVKAFMGAFAIDPETGQPAAPRQAPVPAPAPARAAAGTGAAS